MNNEANTNLLNDSVTMTDEGLDYLKARFEKLAKRAEKIGCAAPTLDVVRTWVEERKGKKLVMHEVAISAPALMVIDGWSIRAELQHDIDELGTVVRLTNPGYPIPESYRTASPSCDHCAAKRRRKTTYVLTNATAIKQIGATCMRDFLGGHHPERAVGIAALLGLVSDALTTARGMAGGTKPVESLEGFLGYVALTIRLFGWTSKKSAWEQRSMSTAVRAWEAQGRHAWALDQLAKGNDASHVHASLKSYAPTEEDKLRAKLAADWAASLFERADLDDYLHNVSVYGSAGIVDQKGAGICASIVTAYERAQKDEQRVANTAKLAAKGPKLPSEWFGEKGGKIDQTMALAGYWCFGATHLYRFEAEGDAVAVCRVRSKLTDPTGKPLDVSRISEPFVIKASVLKHDEYKGTKQTHLSKVRVASK